MSTKNIYYPTVPERSKPLSSALSTTSGLQAAIDSSKHGAKQQGGNGTVKIQQLLQGKREHVTTIAVHHNKTKDEVLRLWCSVLSVSIVDLELCIHTVVSQNVTYYDIHLDPMKMVLYSVSVADITEVFNEAKVIYEQRQENLPQEYCNKYPEFVELCGDTCVVLRCTRIKTSHRLYPIRQGKVLPFEWIERTKVSQDGREVYSFFNGDIVEDLLCMDVAGEGDDIFCTDSLSNVGIMGRVETNRLYCKYASGANRDVYIGAILCSEPRMLAYDFNTAPTLSVTHGLTVEQQKKVLTSACTSGKRESLSEIPGGEILLGVKHT